MTIATRVALGVAHLDNVKPDWWHADNLDLDTLNQRVSFKCVLGQNFPGGYWQALHKVGLTDAEAVKMGFNMDYSMGGDYKNDVAYTEEWRKVVKQRRHNAASGLSAGPALHFEAPPAQTAVILDETALIAAAKKGVVDLYLAASGRPESDRVLVQALLG